jgi:hypothetical protein
MAVSDLMQRLAAQTADAATWDWQQTRRDIHTEHERATTAADREALLGIHKAVMAAVERQIRREDLEAFRKARTEDYNLLIIKEATIGDDSSHINPQRLAAITRREVEAGRIAPDDELHKLAVAGATILTPPPPRMPGLTFAFLIVCEALAEAFGPGLEKMAKNALRTAKGDERAAAEIMKKKVKDRLMKDESFRELLEPAIRAALVCILQNEIVKHSDKLERVAQALLKQRTLSKEAIFRRHWKL